VSRINGALYIWRASSVRGQPRSRRQTERHLTYEVPESRAISVDNADRFERVELQVRSGLITLPRLTGFHAR